MRPGHYNPNKTGAYCRAVVFRCGDLRPGNHGGRGPVPGGGYPLPYTRCTGDLKTGTVNGIVYEGGLRTNICKIPENSERI